MSIVIALALCALTSAEARLGFYKSQLLGLQGEPEQKLNEVEKPKYEAEWDYTIKDIGKVRYTFKGGLVSQIIIIPERRLNYQQCKDMAEKVGKCKLKQARLTRQSMSEIYLVRNIKDEGPYGAARYNNAEAYYDGKTLTVTYAGQIESIKDRIPGAEKKGGVDKL